MPPGLFRAHRDGTVSQGFSMYFKATKQTSKCRGGLHSPSSLVNNLLLSYHCWDKNLFFITIRVQQICLACLDPSKLHLCVCCFSDVSPSFSVLTLDLSSVLKSVTAAICKITCTVWEICWIQLMSNTSYFWIFLFLLFQLPTLRTHTMRKSITANISVSFMLFLLSLGQASKCFTLRQEG